MGNIERIQRLSRIMQHLCLAIMVSLPLLMLWIWSDFERFAPLIGQNTGVALQPQYIGSLSRFFGFVCSMLPVAVTLYGLLRLNALFALYRNGQFFTEANALHLRMFAVTLFINALLMPVTSAALTVVLTMGNPPGQRMLAFSVGSGQIATAFVAAVFTIVAWIMLEGRRLADENAEIV